MGGTFDPIHYGHLLAAEAAREALGLEEIWFVPCGQPALPKAEPPCAGHHRYSMTVLATVTHPQFRVSRVELDRPGPSYAVDTVRFFRTEVAPEAEWYFITGADALAQLPEWYEYRTLLHLCHFVAVTRPGYDAEEFRQQLAAEIAPQVQTLRTPGVDISSSEIRERVRTGRSIRYLTPDPVAAYIYKHRLYLAG